ncbi:hypothetical protein BATDEDRAFT_24353 [Batrachochytrium dendrobatidis JAM81]|uniref:Cyclin-like domain-containing protein n=2 Tax=Batrachochytrium dendrobatidis TaxID=109871 RepID=F4P1Q8_BATDJ|nr:uncharacterized protein BATDEDRAFT_24353 [Batrachochytrium dendrobatidis JAM81]EGF80876.1 hypothetical protein BATDEDRAFT_24353 [Batrachochytrium dendrobatidis JAM81]KAJ8328659.1 hypothetical protein O5D80_002648 [Batrachochytrium dendrobatidis]KAK5668622.1 hypothetical protein QVD99_004416 [Batrachochytrium dendrobatidis]OAJ41516.1 cyclin domain-containing protein [Batrachochytrium dendrobatidis JEL423]|eukprot:XP_006678422.1 hypothetical protein BATDEDRAFT_24353 [Batrachochytrium dendrobatidis JAM81]
MTHPILDPEVLQSQYLVLFQKENLVHLQPTPGFLQRTQAGYISIDQRRELVDWIHQVWMHFKYRSTETFHLAISLIDRVCSMHPVHIKRYQILGAACFWIACKFTEPDPPSYSRLVSLSGGAFDAETLKAEELMVLKRLQWNLSMATPSSFLELMLMFMPITSQHRHDIYQYAISFLAIMPSNYHMLQYASSVQSAASLLVVFASTGSNYEFCHRFLAQHTRQLMMDSSAMAMGLQPPMMSDVNACASDMMLIVRQTFPEFKYAACPSALLQNKREMAILQQPRTIQTKDAHLRKQHSLSVTLSGSTCVSKMSESSHRNSTATLSVSPVSQQLLQVQPSGVSKKLTQSETGSKCNAGRQSRPALVATKQHNVFANTSASTRSVKPTKPISVHINTSEFESQSNLIKRAVSPVYIETLGSRLSPRSAFQPPRVIVEDDDPEYADFSFASPTMLSGNLDDTCLGKDMFFIGGDLVATTISSLSAFSDGY